MLGYSNNAQANQETFSAGWLRTGDLGYYDQDGFIFVVDRIKELIKVKGMQVAWEYIASKIFGHHRNIFICCVCRWPLLSWRTLSALCPEWRMWQWWGWPAPGRERGSCPGPSLSGPAIR